MANNNNNKMKGLLKGLRYISQIFENEKEQEMQIGFPTDVKHVAHIGWDGPSVNSPSWLGQSLQMNEFKSPPTFSSAPLNLTGDQKDGPRDGEIIRRSGRAPNSTTRDLPELPKASRRQHLAIKGGDGASGLAESPTRGKAEKGRHRRTSKHASGREATDSPRQGRRSMDSNLGIDSPARNSTDMPKKNRRKKSKESIASGGGSSRSRSKAILASPGDQFMSPFSDPGPDPDKDSELNYQKSPVFNEGDEIKELIA